MEPLTILQKPVAAGNWKPMGPPRKVRAVVLHVAEGNAASVDSWFANPAADVSAQFLVRLDGVIHQYVSVHDKAHHAGIIDRPTWDGADAGNINATTIGIEHEGYGTKPWPAEQLHASAMLSAWCAARFDLVPTPDDFPLHREIRASKTCPGPTFDRDAYLARVDTLLRVLDLDALRALLPGLR